jgi:hypothetical protein
MGRFFLRQHDADALRRGCETLGSGSDGAAEGHQRRAPEHRRHFTGEPRVGLGDVLNHDVDLVEALQRGQKPRGFRVPLWSQQERRIRHYQPGIDRYIEGEQ